MTTTWPGSIEFGKRRGAVEAVLDILAPKNPAFDNERFAIFEWAKETTPTNAELHELAEQIADAVASSLMGEA